MALDWNRLVGYAQLVLGTVAFMVTLGLCAWLRPRLETLALHEARRASRSRAEAGRVAAALQQQSDALALLEKAVDACAEATLKLKAGASDLADNQKEWGKRTLEFAGISKQLAALGREGSLWLPVKVPFSRKPILEDEKKMLLKIVRDLTEVSRKLAETSRQLEKGAGGMDDGAVESLEKTHTRLLVAKKTLATVRSRSIPAALADLRTEDDHQSTAAATLATLAAATTPATLLLCLLSAGLALNGVHALAGARRLADS